MQDTSRQNVRNKKSYSTWLSHEQPSIVQVVWFLVILCILAWLSGNTDWIWLTPPFGATLTILMLLPEASIAQPFPVIIGSTVGAGIGEVILLIGHGPYYAVLAAIITLILLSLLRIFHPPAVALSMFTVLLHTNIWFPIAVVLPLEVIAVVSRWCLSICFVHMSTYPLPLHQKDHAPS
ncbi:MAG: HPP family protein [Acidibacillus sp.]|nr:HPP family protein [Acidibacillus sp.]